MSFAGTELSRIHGRDLAPAHERKSTLVMVDHLTYHARRNWPINLNKKSGPSDALSKN